jgi:Uma2 family endonuclease
MPPAFSDASNRNFNIAVQLGSWASKDGTGLGFDSSAGFTLPNGAMRSPDACWILQERWDALTPEQQAKFAPICPDFVIELMSRTDTLSTAQAKMQEYQDNGARLGWLINRRDRQVEIYRIGKPVEILQSPISLSGETVLPEFVLDLASIW